MPTSKFDIFLQKVFKSTGMASQMELAAALQINRSAITQARRKNAIPDKWILQLYRLFGLNPDWLEKDSGPVFIKSGITADDKFNTIAKVRARLCAGDGSFEVGAEIEDYFAFQTEWLRKKGDPNHMVLMDIFGNSMSPEIKDGDAVLIDQSQKNILAGAIYAVGVDDTIMVKRLEKHPHKLVLLSDNQDYTPIYLQNRDMHSVRIIGKVIWTCREFR